MTAGASLLRRCSVSALRMGSPEWRSITGPPSNIRARRCSASAAY